jgi:lysozyme
VKLTGRVSWFGGPYDEGVSPDEGLAFIFEVEQKPYVFLPEQPPDTSGLARRLNPQTFYIACRWDYSKTSKELLRSNRKAMVYAPRTGEIALATPADWGPHEDTGRIADISSGLMDALGIQTDDVVEVYYPWTDANIGEGGDMPQVNPLVVDLSHWDPAYDYDAVANEGIVGVIYKATEGGSYTDPTYVSQQHAAKVAGLMWGAYHFADSSDVGRQVENFLNYACPDPDELFCLDWEDNGGDSMPLEDVKIWIEAVETALCRPGQCVLYGGNTIKENCNADPFLTKRRLWLCQYGNSVTLPEGWDNYWLWQFTDGVYGPAPHTIDGIGNCDINSYVGSAAQLIDEWATGSSEVVPPEPIPPETVVNIIVAVPEGVKFKVREIRYEKVLDIRRRGRRRRSDFDE